VFDLRFLTKLPDTIYTLEYTMKKILMLAVVAFSLATVVGCGGSSSTPSKAPGATDKGTDKGTDKATDKGTKS
jgi:hypothetical protein